MILNGCNLGERHRDLNSKVAEAAAHLTNFEELKSQPEKHDVDKLFKIDLASKYKNINYILEVLKCGDVFYITRALECLWMYSNEYSQFINTVYLDSNIFSSMSITMKRKMLTAISIHMKDADRAVEFYEYCTNAKLKHYADKFLVFTPDSYKLHLLKTKNFKGFTNLKYLNKFIGSSTELALSYLVLWDNSSNVIQELRFLYSMSDENYLNILEKYVQIDPRSPHCYQRLGIRISKDILIKHKQRVLTKSLLYVNKLNKSMLIKHLTVVDVKLLTPGLLPYSYQDFWSLDFYKTYKFILEKIPTNEIFGYLKEIYISKYNGDIFEMRVEFYRLKYYEMLNIVEREAWALQHIERDKQLPGIRNYIWYKFVSFPKAFSGIKRYIFLTPDKDERLQIVNILPETGRNHDDIREILCYYYGRHVNESEEHKESFVNKIIEHHDVYSFNEECWTLLDNILYSLNVYTTGSYIRGEYKFMSLIYHILHEKELPEAINEYLENFYCIESIIKVLSEERKVIVAKYIINHFVEKIKSLMNHPDYDDKGEEDIYTCGSIKSQIQDLVWKITTILKSFNRPDEDYPEVVVQFMESNMDFYQYHEKYRQKFEIKTEEDFVRWLKTDKEMALDGIYEIRCNTYRWNFRLSRLFRKLKVYFPTDVGKEYLDYFMEYLSDVPKGYREYRNIKMAVVGVFYLADPESVISFLEKNVPTTPKIDHKNIGKQLLQVQKAICRLAYHARPPLPISVIKKYITGDYVHFCTPIIYNYFANLPSNEDFIESLLDAPLSIQKHGLRLAFRSYDVETLKPIITNAWKKTKNVSLRMILYETLFHKILAQSDIVQRELYEVLKLYTSELNHDDHENVYSFLVSDSLPDVFKGDFIETAWITVNKLSDKSVDIDRRIKVIRHMEKYIHLVQREFLRVQIIDDHVNDMLCLQYINEDPDEYYFEGLFDAKWHLTAKYVIRVNDKNEQQKSLQLMRKIMTEILKSWDLVKDNTYTVRKFIKTFLEIIMNKDSKTVESCANTVAIYQCIRDKLKSVVQTEEMYLLDWELKLSIKCRNIIHKGRKTGDTEADKSGYMSTKEIAEAYGKFVVNLIIKDIEKEQFYRCFYQRIADIVNNVGCTICNILGIGGYGFVYYVCDTLINVKMTETHLLALFMLPRDPDRSWVSEHKATITNIKTQSVSKEVRAFLYEKYVLSDFEVRHYVS